jgi:hypothetical protein
MKRALLVAIVVAGFTWCSSGSALVSTDRQFVQRDPCAAAPEGCSCWKYFSGDTKDFGATLIVNTSARTHQEVLFGKLDKKPFKDIPLWSHVFAVDAYPVSELSGAYWADVENRSVLAYVVNADAMRVWTSSVCEGIPNADALFFRCRLGQPAALRSSVAFDVAQHIENVTNAFPNAVFAAPPTNGCMGNMFGLPLSHRDLFAQTKDVDRDGWPEEIGGKAVGLDNCPTVFNPDQDPAACASTSPTTPPKAEDDSAPKANCIVAASCPENTCGKIDDGCGGTIDCTCPDGMICGTDGLCAARMLAGADFGTSTAKGCSLAIGAPADLSPLLLLAAAVLPLLCRRTKR